MLVLRGTKKLRDRVKAPPMPTDATSTGVLGDWFATAIFWKPQVALLVNRRTLVPVLMPLAPASTLPTRAPAAIAAALHRLGVAEDVITAELAEMADVVVGPTDDRSVLGVMNEFVFLAEQYRMLEDWTLEDLAAKLSTTPMSPLYDRHTSPDREVLAVTGQDPGLAAVTHSAKLVRLDGAQPPPYHKEVTGPPTGPVLQLKATLKDCSPPIWRRVLVDSSRTLDHLHDVIQAAFGWWSYHLHEFQIAGTSYGIPDDEGWGQPAIDERTVQIRDVLDRGLRFTYVYDFGDWWEHQILVEETLDPDDVPAVPACTGGRRACPPEDCGGPWGYQELLDILADPKHPEHAERTGWYDPPIDPEAFTTEDFVGNLIAARQTDEMQP